MYCCLCVRPGMLQRRSYSSDVVLSPTNTRHHLTSYEDPQPSSFSSSSLPPSLDDENADCLAVLPSPTPTDPARPRPLTSSALVPTLVPTSRTTTTRL